MVQGIRGDDPLLWVVVQHANEKVEALVVENLLFYLEPIAHRVDLRGVLGEGLECLYDR